MQLQRTEPTRVNPLFLSSAFFAANAASAMSQQDCSLGAEPHDVTKRVFIGSIPSLGHFPQSAAKSRASFKDIRKSTPIPFLAASPKRNPKHPLERHYSFFDTTNQSVNMLNSGALFKNADVSRFDLAN